jgi:hypothetical protein
LTNWQNHALFACAHPCGPALAHPGGRWLATWRLYPGFTNLLMVGGDSRANSIARDCSDRVAGALTPRLHTPSRSPVRIL